MKNTIQAKVGCSGYYNRQWKEIFYPEKLPSGKWFNFYCEHFNTFEINATFYKFPTLKILEAWFKKSPDDFIFSVKAPKLITHINKFHDCQNLLHDFYNVCEQGLQHKLGAILFQLPPSIHYSEEKLDLITSSLKPGYKNVIEFRHKSWWTKNVYDRLTKKNIIFCSVNHPTLPATIIANTSTAYIRLHGSPVMFYSNYSPNFLKALHQTILSKRKIKSVFIYFNNTASPAGVLNARELSSIFEF